MRVYAVFVAFLLSGCPEIESLLVEAASSDEQTPTPVPKRPAARAAETKTTASKDQAPVALKTSARPAVAGRKPSSNRKIATYGQAKKTLRKVYRGRPRTLYCDCPYDPKRMQADRKACDYAPRSMRVNWEHVVPASHLGNHRPSWRGTDSRCRNQRPPVEGRSCARMIDPEFNRMEGDLYNLYPSLMDLNEARSSRKPGEIRGESRRFGKCDFEVERGFVEPRPAMRGDIARTYLYMQAAYPEADILRPAVRRLVTRWDKADPVDDAECARAALIAKIQGNENPFVAEPCRKRGRK